MIVTERLILRQFRETDYDDLFEFLSQLANDEFEGYLGITYDNGKEHLSYRLGSDEYYDECSWRLLEKTGLSREAFFRQNIYFHTDADGNPKWKDTFVYAILNV